MKFTKSHIRPVLADYPQLSMMFGLLRFSQGYRNAFIMTSSLASTCIVRSSLSRSHATPGVATVPPPSPPGTVCCAQRILEHGVSSYGVCFRHGI